MIHVKDAGDGAHVVTKVRLEVMSGDRPLADLGLLPLRESDITPLRSLVRLGAIGRRTISEMRLLSRGDPTSVPGQSLCQSRSMRTEPQQAVGLKAKPEAAPGLRTRHWKL